MKLIFVNRYFYPDQSATAQILADTAFHLAGSGHEIVVLTSRMDYSDPSTQFPPSETIEGVRVHRVRTTRLGRDKLWRRAFDYLSFYVSVFFAVLRLARRGDVVIAKTDPPLLSVPMWLAVRMKRARLVNWLQDLYPEVARELGVGFAQGWIGSALQSLRNASLRGAEMNIAIGKRMADLLRSNGVKDENLCIIPNWSDDLTVQPVARSANPLRKAWGYGPETLVIGYSGNLGRAHDIETVIGAAIALKDEANIRFLFIGGGKLREILTERMQALGLTNIDLKPYQPRKALAQSLSAADIHWATLIPELEGTIVPSKVYGIAAAGRPILFIGDLDGEVAQMIQSYDCGRVFRPGDSQGLTEFLRNARLEPAQHQMWGVNARKAIDSQFNKSHSLGLWEQLIETDFEA